MSEVRLVVAILVPAIFTLILKDFFDLFMTNRYEGKVKQYTIWMLYFLLDTAISMNFKFVGVISMLYSFIILIIFCAVLYREDIKYITLTVLFIICIGAASELIVALGIRAFLNSSQLQQFSLFGSTCSKLIILIIVRIVKLFRVSGIKRLDYMNWLANVSMTAGSLYIVYNLYLLSLNETKLLGSTMSSIIILLLNVICFKMFDKIAADAEIKRKNDIYKQSIDIYKREMEEREEHNEKLRRFRHDIKNHLIAIEKLALSKEYVRLRDYIHQLTDEKGVLQVTTISGNALIDLERFWSCTVLSGMVLSMVLLIAKYAVIPSIFSFALCVVMGILIFIVGPIDDKNRRISSDERCIFYRRLVYVLLFLVFTSALGVILDANRLAFIVSLTMGVFHIVQIIGKNKNMKLLEQ